MIKIINTIIGKLITLANVFRAFTEALFGKAGGGGGAEEMSDAMDSAASASGVAAGNAQKLAGASEKAKKNLGATGIDELNIVSAQTAAVLVEQPGRVGAAFLESHQEIWLFQTLTHLRWMQRQSELKMRLGD